MLLYASFHHICAHTAAMVGVKAGPVFAMYFSSRQAKPLHPCQWQANRGPLGATTYIKIIKPKGVLALVTSSAKRYKV